MTGGGRGGAGAAADEDHDDDDDENADDDEDLNPKNKKLPSAKKLAAMGFVAKDDGKKKKAPAKKK